MTIIITIMMNTPPPGSASAEPIAAKQRAHAAETAETGETQRRQIAAPAANADTRTNRGMEPKQKQFIVVYTGRGPGVCGRPPMGGMVGGLR